MIPSDKEFNQQILVTFLNRTKAGEYSKIDERQLQYSRINAQREETYCEDEEYYYTVQ